MNFHNTANNYFRTAAPVEIRQKVKRRKPLDLPGGLLLWKAVGKRVLWVLPILLAANLWCSKAITTTRGQFDQEQQAIHLLAQEAEVLRKQVERLSSPVRVKISAADKLSLYEPAPGQVHRMW